MKLATFRRLATVLLLVGAIAVSATGCVLVPYPVGGYGYSGQSRQSGHYGHYGHDRQDGRSYRR